MPEVSSFDEAADVLYELYLGVIEEQAGRASAHAVLLGGFDSALVAASLRRLGHDVATYTFGFGDETYEQRNVGLVTATIGSEEHWVRITPEVIVDGLAEFGRCSPEPDRSRTTSSTPSQRPARSAPTASSVHSPETAATRSSWGTRP